LCLCSSTRTVEVYPLSLHDALPISFAFDDLALREQQPAVGRIDGERQDLAGLNGVRVQQSFTSAHRRSSSLRLWKAMRRAFLPLDRKGTRLNSSHVRISYAGICLKK